MISFCLNFFGDHSPEKPTLWHKKTFGVIKLSESPKTENTNNTPYTTI